MIYFIVNKSSRTGKGASIWKQLEQILEEKEVEYEVYFTKYKRHAGELAAQICDKISASGAERPTLAVMGGDGTINEVLNGITDFSLIRFAVIPGGSGNDFARGLGLEKDPEKRLEQILSPGRDACIDLGRVSWDDGKKSRYFGISSGVGLDAIVSKKALTSRLKTFLNHLHLGDLTYILLTVQTLFTMETMEMDVSFEGNESFHVKKAIFSAFMNMSAEGGGVPMAPSAVPDDKKLAFCGAYGIPKWKTFLLLPLLAMGKHEGIHGFRIEPFQNCQIHLNQSAVLHADGEFCGMVRNLQVECLPEILHIIE